MTLAFSCRPQVRMQKRLLLELAGAIKALGSQEADKEPPPPPPPAPVGERVRSHLQSTSRYINQQTMVMKCIARKSRADASAW